MGKEDSMNENTNSAREAEREESTPDAWNRPQETEVLVEKKLGNISISEMKEGISPAIQKEDQGNENATEKSVVNSSTAEEKTRSSPPLETEIHTEKHLGNVPTAEMQKEIATDIDKENQGKENATGRDMVNSSTAEEKEENSSQRQKDDQEEDTFAKDKLNTSSAEKMEGKRVDDQKEDQLEPLREMKSRDISEGHPEVNSEESLVDLNDRMSQITEPASEISGTANRNTEEIPYQEEDAEPIFDGTEVPEMEANRSLSSRSLEPDTETQGYLWPEKAVALKNFVKEKSVVAVSSVLRRLSGKSDDGLDVPDEEDKNSSNIKDADDSTKKSEKTAEKSGWNPLSLIGISRDAGAESKEETIQEFVRPVTMKGQILLYTRLGCLECKEARLFLSWRRLRYIEINIDLYPSRKLELEKIAGSSAVPKVFFNEVLIGGLDELKGLDESGKLDEKIEHLITNSPSLQAPLPPLSGEDDVSSGGAIDELAVVVRKMKDSIIVKDRFYKMRRFTNCFLGSEAVDFLSEDQYLEREEAIEFGRKLASKLFFQHVLDDDVFEDGNNFYRFLDDDPIVSQCQNISRGIIELKPKPILDISSRLKFLSHAIFEAYTSIDGKHVDYNTIHGSEEFARYLRLVEELQRVDLQDMSREEKLAFFVNLYNMMTIHAILAWGHPAGPLERRTLFGNFKYVVGGCPYSLSAIHNGILRGNQRPPYNLIKPFGAKDKRLKVVLPYVEPLVHFGLVGGHRSAPALRVYSPGNIDKELTEAACDFLRSGGLIVDFDAKVAYVSKILKWYSVDFGKNEVEVLKHAANYLEPAESQALLELLSNTQLKVIYQPYDWGLNY